MLDRQGCCLTKLPSEVAWPNSELELWENGEDRKRAFAMLCEAGWSVGEHLVCIGVSASIPMKQWPISQYMKLIDRMSEKYRDMCFVLLGIVDKNQCCEFNCQKVIDLRGRLSLRETVAVARASVLYVGNDTGVMHIAAACDCAVLEISSFSIEGDMTCGISSSSRFSPWCKDALIVQPLKQLDECAGMCCKSYPHCITQVSVDAVQEAAEMLLASRGVCPWDI